MALTLLVEQELGEVGLIDLFEKSRAIWASLAQDAYDYTVKTYPPGATIRHDDVAKALTPVLSVHPTLVDFLRVEKIRGRHWIADFGDYVLEMTWGEIEAKEDGEQS